MRLSSRAIATLGILVAAAFAPNAVMAQAKSQFRPVVVVNDSAITGYDLDQRVQILVVLGISAASRDALRSAAMDQLIEDRLKLQAGKALGIEPSPEMIETALAGFAKQRRISVAEFKALMNNQRVTNMALEDLAGAQAVWRQVIRARFAQRVQPGEAEVDAEIELLKRGGNYEYKMLEIGLPMVGDGRTEEQTRALAEQLYKRLKAGGNFQAAVRKYSRSPSAARGGDVGWISPLRMPPGMQAVVDGLSVGSVTPPQIVPGGITILKLVDRRARTVGNLEDPQLREQIRNQLMVRKSARLAEGYLQELRRDALIQAR